MTEQETCSLSKVPLFEYGELSELKVRQKKKSSFTFFWDSGHPKIAEMY